MRAREFIVREAETKPPAIIPATTPSSANQSKNTSGPIGGTSVPKPPPFTPVSPAAMFGAIAGSRSSTAAPATSPSAAASVPPTFKNIVVPAEIKPPPSPGTVNLNGRNPSKPEDVTHAYRLMSTGELQHAQANGAFLPNPNADRANGWNNDHKYWSSGDSQGQFGRPWGGSDRVAVRVPIDKVNPNTPVDAAHAHVQDKATGAWSPVMPPTDP